MWEDLSMNLLSNTVGITGHEADFNRYAAAYERAARPARTRLF